MGMACWPSGCTATPGTSRTSPCPRGPDGPQQKIHPRPAVDLPALPQAIPEPKACCCSRSRGAPH
eukprot:6066082-Alexandrium_andersonii.AAC.1